MLNSGITRQSNNELGQQKSFQTPTRTSEPTE